MKAIIPCAEKEENLFPFSETKPTALMPVMGKPLIEHNIEALEENGVEEIYIVVNHLQEQFSDRFKDRDGVKLVHQEELDGTASAVKTCDFIEDDFLVLNGDVIVSERDIGNLLQKFRNTGETSILATDEKAPEKFGVLSIQNDEVADIQEKPEEPENPLVNTGIYVFSPEIFEAIEDLEEDETSITDAVRDLIESEGARFELVQDYWIDIGSGEKLWKADQIKREYEIEESEISGKAEVSEDAAIEGEAVVEEGAEIKPGTVIEGKCFIGENSIVGPNTTIRGSSIADNSQLDHCSIENSLVFESNIVDSFVAVEGTVLAEECDIKSGTVIRECLIGARSFIDMNNSIRGTKFVPDARTDLGEISK
ncbi:sugar phosphate nucleotidyltransferase [Candidatus Nanohalobium constans]|uniref:Bifunctional UDP-N-acetylglucosamine pyrophosphorylase / Glucosamine-1-phosphate N-acetyltransferase n=1 Tax=Candidatus Nanohalobium constans TaxID=2565781 RepID=A0A5Q0UHF7_9ARCH|nr:sugar phosphate nucleotidyltransferase [Candidatus Nanohalobium constans]QGA81016.1 bifunctional UDP-N-acetylglucosamine pyrophosphorylase / Glucosamine-1-phosphate N-acetyltransferase [Candidatus Nanohalobium constans]